MTHHEGIRRLHMLISYKNTDKMYDKTTCKSHFSHIFAVTKRIL